MLFPSFSTARVRTGLACLLLALFVAAPSGYAQDDDDNEETKTLDPRVAEDLLKAYEKLEEEEYESALSELNRLLDRRGDRMKDFDKASVLQIRGTAYVNLEDIDKAAEDFAAAIALDALPASQQNQLRFNLAQIYFVNERYEDSLDMFEEWMKADVEVKDSTYFMISAAHYNLDSCARRWTRSRRRSICPTSRSVVITIC